ncbi:SHOCT domain-containing protein [Halobaculum lipolyticum]|uniref:SHOCT domain-containing protein n=1 Tax=Halobaculum lipolyticum TaxID=3032001 RepID=A0ABD5W9Z3_9EURY|nr:SHOCT domain-containing protein [Halobaculum sp. DT31]
MTQPDTLVRPLVLVLAAILLLPLLGMTMMLPMMGLWGWGHMAGTGTWGGSWLWLGMWLVPLALLAAGGYAVYTALRRTADDAPDAAIRELRSAYARGDLSDEEFDRRRERLRRSE